MSEIKVYISKTDELYDPDFYENSFHSVSASRQEKICRTRFKKNKILSLASELLLKNALNDIGIKSYTVAYGERGKPFLKEYPNVHFNLSHSEERVFCALSEKEVGCDVEMVSEIDLAVGLRFFCDYEYQAIIENESQKDRFDAFYRIWTLKESIIKATGLGMALPLNSFCVDIKQNPPAISSEVNGKRYFLKEYDLHDGYKYAVCAEDGNFAKEIIVNFK